MSYTDVQWCTLSSHHWSIDFVSQIAQMVMSVQVVSIYANLQNMGGFVQILETVLQDSATQSQGAKWVSVFYYLLKSWIYVYPKQVN